MDAEREEPLCQGSRKKSSYMASSNSRAEERMILGMQSVHATVYKIHFHPCALERQRATAHNNAGAWFPCDAARASHVTPQLRRT